jgi:hypothetical protein
VRSGGRWALGFQPAGMPLLPAKKKNGGLRMLIFSWLHGDWTELLLFFVFSFLNANFLSCQSHRSPLLEKFS